MKNVLFIDFDSDRKDSVRISKSDDAIKKLEDEKESRQMIVDDLTTVCNALGALIHVAHENGIADKKDSVKVCVDYLMDTFINKKDDE